MKNILALSWCMPPIVMPRSIQVSRLLAALAKKDWQTDVVCVDPSSLRPGNTIMDQSLERPAGGRVKKHPVPTVEDNIVYRGLMRLVPSLAILPDPKWIWKNAALSKCARLASNNAYDAFITFGQPWTDHLVGLKIKSEFKLPWIAHFSDPWADSPYVQASQWVKNKRLEMEQSVINAADAVVFVSQQTLDLVMQKYPDSWRSKSFVIPHGFEPIPDIHLPMRDKDQPVEFLYTGNFYGSRTPETLLKAAAMLAGKTGNRNSFRLCFAGPNTEKYQTLASDLGISDLVTFDGAVSYSASQELSISTDVLLVIDAPSQTSSVFLPSKLVDYLAFKKPILGITPPGGSSANLIQRLGCPVVDPGDVEGIASAMEIMIDTLKTGKNGLMPSFQQTISEYHIDKAAEKMNEILTRLSG